MKVLHIDTNHPLLIEQLTSLGFQNETDYTSSKQEIEQKIADYDGIVIRSRFPIDRSFLGAATRLKFIARVGAGLENIDIDQAQKQGIRLFNAPEGNRDAVGEHTLGMLLALMNKLNKAHREVCQGIWDREGNRGVELKGKTVGIIGYGNMGKAFAKRLKGFEVEVVCYDIEDRVGDKNARQVGIMEFRQKSDVVSLHVPETSQTIGMVDKDFLSAFKKPIWLLNTARGKCVKTADLVEALRTGKVLGAGLDVLEYEARSFENWLTSMPEPFKYLKKAKNVLLTPHVAGWTVESKEKLAQVLVDKIKAEFC